MAALVAEYARPFSSSACMLDATDSFCLQYNCMPNLWRTPFWWAARFDRPRVCRYERRLHEDFPTMHVCRFANRMRLRFAGEGSEMTVLRNGVDLETFRPGGMAVEPFQIIFSGKLDTLPMQMPLAIWLAIFFR